MGLKVTKSQLIKNLFNLTQRLSSVTAEHRHISTERRARTFRVHLFVLPLLLKASGETHPLHMQVLHGLGDGVENSAGFPLREKLLTEDFVQQLASLHQLRHQEHRPAVVIHLRHENKPTHT